MSAPPRGDVHQTASHPGEPATDKPLSSPDRVVAAIINGIAMGRFVPGQRLLEADLTRSLNISRGPVREALKRLAAERIITLTRHRGAHIRSLTRQEVDELMQVIEVLTGFAAGLAARRIDEGGNRAHFIRAYERLMACRYAGDGFASMESRDRFYGAMLHIGHNRELARLLPATQVQLIRMQFQSYLHSADRERLFHEYESIGEAILAGDAIQADRFTRLHMDRSRKIYLGLPDAAFALDSGDNS